MKIAVIEAGGKQYVVSDGSIFTTEIQKTAKDGKVTFDKVLLVDDGKSVTMGAPHIAGAKVTGEIVAEGRAKKVTVLRYRPKSRWKKTKGHRQPFVKVRVTKLP